MADPEVTLRTEGLVKHFPIHAGLLRRQVGTVRAVDGVDIEVRRGETLGVVGESGCGKSTLARTILRLVEPTAGRIVFNGQDITHLPSRQLRAVREHLRIVFQDPFASLNPRMTVAEIVGEPLRLHRRSPRASSGRPVRDLLEIVGLNPEHTNRYPHEFSGGQRQRIAIARALALDPQVLVLDEPVSALDVSIQAQIINLLSQVQDRLGLTYVFISHDLSVVRHICDRIAVMYLGKVVETGSRDRIFGAPTHPYTQALLSAAPIDDPSERGRRVPLALVGDVPNPANPPSGCRFRTRCWKAVDRCAVEEPALVDRGLGHPSACHFAGYRPAAPLGEPGDGVSVPETLP
ncbi:MAG TPA: dipeptide ABC transporter ATP-binding protein [Micromonosporaceae bacterium]|nr:dipeptide ABC transporter ATP-binding protein [Micromonosporaceae bacterium]